MRWKNVASGHAATKSAHAWRSPSRYVRTAGDELRFDRKIEGLHAASISNTRSMRSQRKSERSRCSRDSVRSRFR